MEIVLARHGRPRLDQWSWIAPCQLPDWIRSYDGAGLLDDAPAHVRARAAQSGLIISSPLLRCVKSAEALAPSRDIKTEELLREAELPYAVWKFPRLPATVWAGAFRAAWICGFSANSEPLSLTRIRARSAANRLIELARKHRSVFVMGHGVMTALIARELVLQNWSGPGRPTHGYWQFSIYQIPGTGHLLATETQAVGTDHED